MPTQRAEQADALEATGQDAAWDFARTAEDPAVLIDFLQAYPDSEHATVAFALLEKIAIEAENGVQVTQQMGRPATTPILD